MIIFVIFLLIQINKAIKDLQITIGPLTSDTTIFIVYQDGILNQQFDIGNMVWANCAPFNLIYFKSNLNHQYASTPLTLINTGMTHINIKQILLRTLDGQSLNVQLKNFTQNMIIEKSKSESFDIQYFCEKKLTKQNYWAIIEVEILTMIGQRLNFHYQYICDPNYHPKRFDWSYVILIALMSLFVLVLSRQQKLSAFKVTYYTGVKNEKDSTIFQGFHLGFQSSVLYNIIFFFGVISAYIFEKKVENIEENVVRFFCLFFGFILISELCYKIKFLKLKILWKIRACDIIGILVSIMTLHIYVTNNEPWILSNILTLFLVGTSIKMLKITSLQNAVYFFVPCIFMDIAFSIYASFYIRYEWDSLVMKYFNTPLTAQFPYFYPIYKKRCGWLSITSILFPAFFLAYAHRFDRFRDSIIYRMISFFGLLIGLMLWLTFTSIYSIPLPVSSFTLFPTLGICALIAFQRNEIKTFWTGNFYDQVLQNPWRHQMQRESVHSVNFLRPIELQTLNNNQDSDNQLLRLSQGKVKFDNTLFDGLLEQ